MFTVVVTLHIHYKRNTVSQVVAPSRLLNRVEFDEGDDVGLLLLDDDVVGADAVQVHVVPVTGCVCVCGCVCK